jgi:hypothetical protein
MAFKTGDRVRETSTTTGTGTLTLAGAVAGFQPFSVVCANNDVCYYCITDNASLWEVGLGTWGTGGTLARTAGGVLSGSSGASTLVTFAAGSKDVFITAPASETFMQDNNNIAVMPLTTGVTTPAASNLGIFVKNFGGRMMLSQIGPSGLDTALQPHIGRNRSARWQPIGNATTAPIVEGILAPTALGTATARTVATTNISTMMKRLGYVSASTAGSLCGHYFLAGAQQYTLGTGSGFGGFHFVERFIVSDAAAVSGARQFIGFRNVVTAPTNVDPNTITNCFGLAQLQGDATQWYIVYGGSAAQTAIALGTTIGAPTLTNTAWDLSFFAPPSLNNTVYYTVTNMGSGVTVSGTLTGTAGTALPLNTALLAPCAWRCNNATALACGLDIASMYIETDQ